MFNNEKNVNEYIINGNYPKIHDNIFNEITLNIEKCNMIDMCCCHGLLSERLNNFGYNVFGIEKNKTYINYSKNNNIKSKIFELDVLKSIFELENLIKQNEIKCLVFRRCLPELFSENTSESFKFINMFYNLNIKYIALEGRIFSKRSKNKIPNINFEIDLFKNHFSPIIINKNVSILKTNII